MASPAAKREGVDIIEVSDDEEKEKSPPPPPPSDQPRTVVDISWDRSKQGQIFNVTQSHTIALIYC